MFQRTSIRQVVSFTPLKEPCKLQESSDKGLETSVFIAEVTSRFVREYGSDYSETGYFISARRQQTYQD